MKLTTTLLLIQFLNGIKALILNNYNRIKESKNAKILFSDNLKFETDQQLKIPTTVSEMMNSVADTLLKIKEGQVALSFVEIPLPVTGGTELDDWPGGIKQKYVVMRTLLAETMKSLNFCKEELECRNYVGKYGADDAVGIWRDNDFTLCCFPTLDTVPYLIDLQNVSDKNEIFVYFNQQFFLEQNVNVNKETKSHIESAEIAYLIENLNMRGPKLLPVRGILYRKYPEPFKAARRLDSGKYVIIKTYEYKPTVQELEKIFFDDSTVRDKDLSLFDRLKKQIPNF